MPTLSQSSKNKLATCETQLQILMNEAIKEIDFVVIYGYRSPEEQDALYEKGFSKLKGGKSKHNKKPSMAVDIAPYPIDWKDVKGFYYLAGIIKGIASQLNIKIRWGGDWDCDNDLNDQSFMDLGHFEVVY